MILRRVDLIQVQNAGCKQVNGTYVRNSVYQGKPLFTNISNGFQLWWNGEWVIGHTNDYYYTFQGEKLGPEFSPDDKWTFPKSKININSKQPFPTVSVIQSYDKKQITEEMSRQILTPSFDNPFILKQIDNKSVWNFIPNKFKVIIISFESYESSGKAYWASTQREDRSFAEFFNKFIGVPKSNILCLLDQEATKQKIQKRIEEFLKTSSNDELLYFYWGSHGNYSSENPVQSFMTSCYDSQINGLFLWNLILQFFKGSHAFIGFDTCYSGCMPLICKKYNMRKNMDDLKIFAISSTYYNQVAYSRWRFLRCLKNGLVGHHSLSILQRGNQQGYTVEEFAKYCRDQMAFQANGFPIWIDHNFHSDSGFMGKYPEEAEVIRKLKQKNNVDKQTRVRFQTKGKKIVPLRYISESVVQIQFCSNCQLAQIDQSDIKLFQFPALPKEKKVGYSGRNYHILNSYEHLYLLGDQQQPLNTCWASSDTFHENLEYKYKVEIESCGLEEAVGIYHYYGQYKSLPAFKNSNGVQLWWNSEWRIGRTNFYMYINKGKTEQIPVQNWVVGSKGISPSPILRIRLVQ